MKKTKILSLIMVLALCLSAMVALSIGSSAELGNVAKGKTVTSGTGSSVTNLTDGSTDGYYDLGFWSETDGGEPFGTAGTCYVEIDLGEETTIEKLRVVNLVSGSRVYKWEAYATTDNTADISTWTKIGEKTNDDITSHEGTTVEVADVNARYVRVYGTYHSDNIGYHLAEVEVYAEYVAPELTWPDTLSLAPKFVTGGCENWRGSTWFLCNMTATNEGFGEIGSKMLDGTYTVNFVITDTTENKTYTLSDYAFDHDDTPWAEANNAAVWKNQEVESTNTVLRICASDYQVPVIPGHTYSISGTVYEGETLKYNITSDEYAPLADKLTAEAGPAEGFEAPHCYDEAEVDNGGDGDDNTGDNTGDGDVDAGDATALIAVLAVVALFGAAVVSKKVFVK